MQSDSLLVPETLIKPRSFVGLMSLYESNFLRLHQLIPALATISGEHVSTTPKDLPLFLSMTERTRYTCTLDMTYEFTGPEGDVMADPDLRLRVYFDGQLAEVMSLSAQHRHRILKDIAAAHREELDSRWQRNMMLNKWLEFLLDAGHGFTPGVTER